MAKSQVHKPKSIYIFCITLITLILGACGSAPRPTLVPIAESKQVQLEVDIELPPAPKGTPLLDAASADTPGESSVGDAIFAWTTEIGLNYVEDCSLVQSGHKQYCSIPTDRDQIRLLGYNDSEIHYVLVVEDVDPGLANSYRVTRVIRAGD